jgi:hypothetical protein
MKCCGDPLNPPLDGSVRRSGPRVRVGAELSDADSGRQVWAESYDVPSADFLALQDEISLKVIAAIEPQLHVAEHARVRSRPPGSLDAWGWTIRAMPGVWTWATPAEITASEAMLAKVPGRSAGPTETQATPAVIVAAGVAPTRSAAMIAAAGVAARVTRVTSALSAAPLIQKERIPAVPAAPATPAPATASSSIGCVLASG